MRFELVPGTSNVVRFPLPARARPRLEILREIAPDVRDVLAVAETFELDCPLDELRQRADAAMAMRIAESVPLEPGPRRASALADLLAPLVERAIVACRRAHDASAAAVEAQRRVIEARAAGGYWMEPLDKRARERADLAARLLIEAFVAREEAEGAARAVGLAERNEPWRPYDVHSEANALFFGAGGSSAPR
jgi:hypothetical protein